MSPFPIGTTAVTLCGSKRSGFVPVLFRPGLVVESVGEGEFAMAKNAKKLKRANHGKRPASAKARRAKRAMIKT